MRVSEAKTGVKPMATTTNLLSWEAFEQLPDDGMHYEILAGELIISVGKVGYNVCNRSDCSTRTRLAVMSAFSAGVRS